MKVILLEDIKSLGKKDQIVDVNDGYARNFLIKNKKAKEATNHNLNTLKVQLGSREAARQRDLEQAQILAEKLKDKVFKIMMKTGEGGRLYGSLTSAEVALALKKEGFSIDKKNITLKTALKNVGETSANLRLHTEVKVDVKIIVESIK